MKYSTFRLVRLGVIVVLCIGIVIGLRSCMGCGQQHMRVENHPENRSSQPTVQSPASQPEARPTLGAAVMPITDADRAVLSYHDSPLVKNLDDSGENYKKFVKASGYNLDLRCDFKKGFDGWNRIKVDWDKDKQWDEKWSFNEKGEVKRQISPDDDGNYAYSYILQGTQWVLK